MWPAIGESLASNNSTLWKGNSSLQGIFGCLCPICTKGNSKSFLVVRKLPQRKSLNFSKKLKSKESGKGISNIK